jgi:hypothetical protein
MCFQFSKFAAFILGASLFSASLCLATTYNMAYVAFDVTNPPLAEVDIANQTGPNSSAPDFLVSTPVSLNNLSLTLDFATGPSETFDSTSGYFTLAPDGLSYNGQDIFNISTDPVTSAILTGNFSTTTVSLVGGGTVTIGSTFKATITPSSGTNLADGDFALITATTSTGPPPGITPEPETWALFCAGLLGFGIYRCSRSIRSGRMAKTLLGVALFCCLLAAASNIFAATTSIKLNVDTTPSSGVSGTTLVWVTGSGFPGAPNPSATTISLAATCGGTTAATATPTAVTNVVGNSYKLEFLVPASLATATYEVSIAGTTTGGAAFASSNCSALQATHTSSVLASCNPGSSMGILSYNPTGAKTTPVTAYVPNAAWGGGTTGILVVPIEGGGSPASITTSSEINSCSSNSITGTSVCIDNVTGVYILSGTSITNTLTSGANAYESFSGGSCENCTVAINEAQGKKGAAVIGMGFAGSSAGSGLQFLDLSSLTFGTVVPLANEHSEDILWDPFHNRVLSPNEAQNYDLVAVNTTNTPGPSTTTEYANYMGSTGGEPDSAALDCTTDIALSTVEFSGNLYIADLSQATFTAGTPGSWSAPSQIVNFPEFDYLLNGTTAIAVAPGSTHLGIVNGEFGGNLIGAIQLPSKSGSGTPSFVDYVAATLPATPDTCTFSAGDDPHTTTAYTSPNNGKAYGVVADWVEVPPDYLAVIDLAALLAAKRSPGTHSVDPSVNLVASGIVTYVPTGAPTCASADAKPFILGTKPVNKPIAH